MTLAYVWMAFWLVASFFVPPSNLVPLLGVCVSVLVLEILKTKR